MTYTVLARKYRPQKFADLVGQEHVTRTIGNALHSDRVAHAFLFTGARGVGKTSTARLLARALNCEQGPSAEPCNSCDPCREITLGHDLDVLEIDGASNNSVDDVRRLQEGLPYRPARDRFKVVIVDEVHMLSTGAFNAFLKTLEEPPAHVKFIFATTEVHKVPVTIRSRCQRHDFRLIPQAVIAQHIERILEAEQIRAEQAAIHLVAREAAGSMRDALTVLDQLLAFSGDTLTEQAVTAGLGIAGREQVHQIAGALLQGDPGRCLRGVSATAEAGLDLLHFARQLLEYLRDLVVLKVVGDDGDLVNLTPDERTSARALCDMHQGAELERAFTGVSTLVDTMAMSAAPRITLEMGLVRLADRPRLQPLADLVARLDAVLAEGPSGSGGPAGGSGGPTGGSAPGSSGRGGGPGPRPSQGAGRGGTAQRAASHGAGPGAEPAQQWTQPRSSGAAIAPTSTTNRPAERSSAETASPEPGPELTARGEGEGKRADGISAPRHAAAEVAGLVDEPVTRRERPSLPGAAESPTEAPRPTADATAHSKRAGASVADGWPSIVNTLRERQPALSAILEHGVATEVSPERVVLRFPEGSFFGRQAQSDNARKLVLEAAERVLGRRPELRVEFGKTDGHATLAQVEDEARKARIEDTRKAALNHPAVVDAMEVFPETCGNANVRVEME